MADHTSLEAQIAAANNEMVQQHRHLSRSHKTLQGHSLEQEPDIRLAIEQRHAEFKTLDNQVQNLRSSFEHFSPAWHALEKKRHEMNEALEADSHETAANFARQLGNLCGVIMPTITETLDEFHKLSQRFDQTQKSFQEFFGTVDEKVDQLNKGSARKINDLQDRLRSAEEQHAKKERDLSDQLDLLKNKAANDRAEFARETAARDRSIRHYQALMRENASNRQRHNSESGQGSRKRRRSRSRSRSQGQGQDYAQNEENKRKQKREEESQESWIVDQRGISLCPPGTKSTEGNPLYYKWMQVPAGMSVSSFRRAKEKGDAGVQDVVALPLADREALSASLRNLGRM